MMAEGGLTVMAANLWHDWPRQHRWIPRLQAVADLAVAYQVDILLLQEVARTRSLHSDEWLAQALGMERAYARANGSARAIGFEEGLAILSRYRVHEPRVQRLGRSRLIQRIALAATVDTPLGRVWMSASSNRQARPGRSWMRRTWTALPAAIRITGPSSRTSFQSRPRDGDRSSPGSGAGVGP